MMLHILIQHGKVLIGGGSTFGLFDAALAGAELYNPSRASSPT
jgi:hypothetical protein